jgi:hypothetical protein
MTWRRCWESKFGVNKLPCVFGLILRKQAKNESSKAPFEIIAGSYVLLSLKRFTIEDDRTRI